MFCNNCGTKLEDGISFCPNCGAAVMLDNTVAEDDDKTVILGAWSGETENVTAGDAADQNAMPEQSEETAQKDAGSEQPEEEGKEDAVSGQTEKPAGEVSGAETIETVAISPTGVVNTGTAVVVPNSGEQKKFCPNCGAENSLNDLFCQQCGMFFGNAEAKMNGGNAAAPKRRGGAGKLVALIVVLLAVIGLGVVFVPRIIGGSGTDEKDFIMYVKDNELTMARKSKYEPMVVGDRLLDDKDQITNGYHFAYYQVAYSPDYKYVYYPQKADNSGFDLYRKKLGSKKEEAEKIDSQVISYAVIDDNKLVYIKDNQDRKLYLYDKGESQKIDSNVWMMQVSADGKHVLWRAENKLYVQDTNMKADKVKLDSDVSDIFGISEDLETIVYRKDDNLYVLKGMDEKEKIASDIYAAYVYDIDHSLKVYYLKEGDEENLSYYDLIEDDYLSQDQQMQEPRIEDYQKIVYKDSFWGVQEKVEVDDSYYEEVEKYKQKQSRDYLRDNLENYTLALEEREIYYYEDASGDSEKVLTALMQSEDMGMAVYGSIGTNTALMYVGNTDLEKIRKPVLSDLTDMDYYEMQEQIADRLLEGSELLYLENGEAHEIEEFEGESEYPNLWANEDERVIYISDYGVGSGKLYCFPYGEKNASLEMITDELSYVASYDMDDVCYLNEDMELYYGDEMIAEDVGSVTAWEDSLLYLTDMDKDGEEGTLYLYQNGKSTEIADDVAIGLYGMFDTDKVVFLTDYNFTKYRGDLNVYDGNKVKKIDSDVTRIIY